MKYFHAHYFDLLGINVAKMISTTVGRLKAVWWGVSLGKGACMRGRVESCDVEIISAYKCTENLFAV